MSDPFSRFEFRRKINIQAILAFVVGVLVAYFLQISMGLGGGGIFTALIIVAVGGFWYHLRRVI